MPSRLPDLGPLTLRFRRRYRWLPLAKRFGRAVGRRWISGTLPATHPGLHGFMECRLDNRSSDAFVS
jgi:hypothetical protein